MPRRPEVDAWFAAYENPMKPVVQRIREIILAADPRMDECIKWKAPTFTFQGNMASFFPRSMKHASLMFHTGASLPGDHPRLTGGAGTSRHLKLATVAEVNEARAEIEAIVAAWCDLKSGAPATKEKATKPTPPAKAGATKTTSTPKRKAPKAAPAGAPKRKAAPG